MMDEPPNIALVTSPKEWLTIDKQTLAEVSYASMRGHIASRVLAGFSSSAHWNPENPTHIDTMVRLSVAYADALIERLSHP